MVIYFSKENYNIEAKQISVIVFGLCIIFISFRVTTISSSMLSAVYDCQHIYIEQTAFILSWYWCIRNIIPFYLLFDLWNKNVTDIGRYWSEYIMFMLLQNKINIFLLNFLFSACVRDEQIKSLNCIFDKETINLHKISYFVYYSYFWDRIWNIKSKGNILMVL